MFNNKIEIKNGQITIENLQELTKGLGIHFNNLVVQLSNGQNTSLNYLFISDMNTLCNGYTIETLLINRTKYGLLIEALGQNGKYLTSYTIYQIAGI
jgi:hypothetical protein